MTRKHFLPRLGIGEPDLHVLAERLLVAISRKDALSAFFSTICADTSRRVCIAEAYRAMSIAGDYGFSLLAKGQNIEESGLGLILSAYPSHGYVIDREEASTLFRKVREPTPLEIRLEEMFGESARCEVDEQQDEQPFRFLSPDRSMDENGNNREYQEESNHAQSSEEDAGTGCGNANETAHGQFTERGERAPVSELDTARGTRGKRRGAK